MDDLDRCIAEHMKDPEFAAEWERLEPEYDIITALIDARCGMKQSAISRLEAGGSNPTLKTLVQLAHGMGKKLKISFV